MTSAKHTHVARWLLLVACLLTCSCQTRTVRDVVLPQVAFHDNTLEECVAQIRAQLREGRHGVPAAVLVDRAPAYITWINIAPANSNAAACLVDEYAENLREWTCFVNTNLISLEARWVSLNSALGIVTSYSEAVRYNDGNRVVIRYGSPQLYLRQYAHDGWRELMGLLGITEDRLAETFGAADRSKAIAKYIPDTNVVLLLGTVEQHAQFWKEASESLALITHEKGSINSAARGTGATRP